MSVIFGTYIICQSNLYINCLDTRYKRIHDLQSFNLYW